MKIILSPAKKMNVDTDSLPHDALPQFLPETQQLLHAMQAMSDGALQTLWGCSDALASLNLARLRNMNLQTGLTPAILSYEGIQYQTMAPGIFEKSQFAYIHTHLRILSGFYGILRPFDGVTPYRLEMQTKLSVGDCKNLYDFWGDKLARQLCAETDCILNLASKEYSRAVTAHLPNNKSVRCITCTFGERSAKGAKKVIEKGTLCKIARGEMVRWMAENNVTNPEDVKAFQGRGYAFHAEFSNDSNFVFVKNAGSLDDYLHDAYNVKCTIL